MYLPDGQMMRLVVRYLDTETTLSFPPPNVIGCDFLNTPSNPTTSQHYFIFSPALRLHTHFYRHNGSNDRLLADIALW